MLNTSVSGQFQNYYGTSLNNSFSKAFQHGSNYYVLGSKEISPGVIRATITYLDAAGTVSWVKDLDVPAQWNDAVLTPTGDLMVVGHTLPLNSSNKSLIGRIDPVGMFAWVRSYDELDLEMYTSIVLNPNPQNPAFPYYVLGSQLEGFTSSTTDLLMVNLDENGLRNWKTQFGNSGVDDVAHDLEALPSGHLLIAGGQPNVWGTVLRTDNTGLSMDGLTPSGELIVYTGVAGTSAGNGEFYAIARSTTNSKTYVFKYDVNPFPLWEYEISGLHTVDHVWELSPGEFCVIGRGLFNGFTRSVVMRFTDNITSITLQWLKFLDNGETGYLGGSATLLSGGRIGFVDGRTPAFNGFGDLDAFMAVTNSDLISCITKSNSISSSPVAFLYNSPVIFNLALDALPPAATVDERYTGSSMQDACASALCNAAFSMTYSNNPCGLVQFTDLSTSGSSIVNYCWDFNGDLSSCESGAINPSYQFQAALCQNFTACLIITTATGCKDTICQPVLVADVIPPVITCPPNLTVSCAASTTPSLTGYATATDNCTQNLAITYSDFILPNFPCNGSVLRTWSTTDMCANVSTCIQVITVRDNTPPVITNCPVDVTITFPTNEECYRPALLSIPVVTDDCDQNVVIQNNYNLTPDASDLYPEGNTLVTYTAMDDCGNSSTCSFTVTVICDVFPGFNCGNAFVTCFSGFIGGDPVNGVDLSSPVFAKVDVRDQSGTIPGNYWQNASENNIYHAPSWNANTMGQVFGLAINHSKDVFLAATTVYACQSSFNQFGPAGASGIYRVDHSTGGITALVSTGPFSPGTKFIPSNGVGGGLGNICFDADHSQLFVTSHSDGMIYRIDANGFILDRFDPQFLNNPVSCPASITQPGFIPLGERIWGIGYNKTDGRLYFSRWVEDIGRICSNDNNQIFSVGIDPTSGGFLATSCASGNCVGGEILEISMPDHVDAYNQSLYFDYSMPVSDIEFSEAGRMLVGERSMGDDCGGTDHSKFAHGSRMLEYEDVGIGWQLTPGHTIPFCDYGQDLKFSIGTPGLSCTGAIYTGGPNSAGGVTYGYKTFNYLTEFPVNCDSMVWSTGDALYCNPTGLTCVGANCSNPSTLGDRIYGLQGNSASGGKNCTGLLIDLNADLCCYDKRLSGDVDVLNCCGDTCVPCENVFVVITEYDSCCYGVDLSYVCGDPFFSKIEFDILTPGVYFGAQSISQAWNYCGPSSLTSICIEPSSGSVQMGQHFNFISFCLTNIDNLTPSPQSIKVKYWMIGSNGQDSLACDTTLLIYGDYCKKYCASVSHDNIHCLEDSMKYEITVTVQNNSSPPFIAHHLSMIGPGISPNPVSLIPPLPNDGTSRTVTFCYTPIPWPDPDGLLFLTYGLSSITGDTSCYGGPGLYDTLVLTACDTCLCLGFQNVNFYYSGGTTGWQSPVYCDSTLVDTFPCIPPLDFYHFKGEYLCSNACQSIVDYEIYSVDLSTTIQTGTTTTINIGNNITQFDLVNGFQLISGHYQLILEGHCGSDYCRCVIDFFIQDCDPLCLDNLVKNPGFELYNQCPTTISNIIQADFWTSPTLGTPDYYNACAAYGNFADVPHNFGGDQIPHNGTAYGGFIFYRTNTIKEYIETQLLSPLIAGTTYEISFYVNLANASRLAIDNIGAYLSNTPVGPTFNLNPLSFNPHISSPVGIPITDKNGWTQIKGTVTPPLGSNYNYLVIGNFVNTTTVVNTGAGFLNDAYYYVDDVSVCEKCPPPCATCTCDGFQDFAAYYSNGFVGWEIGMGCNTNDIDTLPCIPSGELYHFKGKFTCSDSCNSSVNYKLISLATNTSISSGQLPITSLGNYTSEFEFIAGINPPPGNYQLVLTAHCGSDSCQCIVDWFIPYCDTCFCGNYTDITLDWGKPIQDTVNCGDLINVEQGKPLTLSADFFCNGDQCNSNPPLSWYLYRLSPLTLVTSGSGMGSPSFSISITPSAFNVPGMYELAMVSYCQATDSCTCSILLNSLGVGTENIPGLQSVIIYPNPNTGEFTVDLTGLATQASSLRVTGLAGQVLSEGKIEDDVTLQKIILTDLTPGMYFLQILSEGRVVSVNKFVKM